MIRALARSLALAGVPLRTGEAVTGLLHEAGRVSGVRTQRDASIGDAVVVAAGAWSSELIGPLAVQWGIEPVRGQMLLFQAPPGLVRHMVLRDSRGRGPRRGGRGRAGGAGGGGGGDRT